MDLLEYSYNRSARHVRILLTARHVVRFPRGPVAVGGNCRIVPGDDRADDGTHNFLVDVTVRSSPR